MPTLSTLSFYLTTAILSVRYSKVTAYTALAHFISHDAYGTKAMPTNNTDYSCHIKAIELI